MAFCQKKKRFRGSAASSLINQSSAMLDNYSEASEALEGSSLRDKKPFVLLLVMQRRTSWLELPLIVPN